MTLDGILPFARLLIQKTLSDAPCFVDATAGNGHDTVFLAGLAGEDGRVFAFDVQEQAIHNTKKRVAEAGFSNRVSLFHSGHEEVRKHIPDFYHRGINAAIFNLGYLPKGDKSIITRPDTTIEAIRQLFDMLKPGGLIVLVVYHGHAGGADERNAVVEFAAGLDQQRAHVMQYGFINQVNTPPFIVAIEKRPAI
ncbi:class I SAM-dependent methyltransferase [Domibacillus sp. DTU_2020_1001157_1_SI_ALB_TIR_016]|uniref:tRNA (mnm(5)s(2)U34)-methyltransferase n=1 Tax=Domibacillus sp. DTU_2020_1001157_1_SI_ALB_TIR_016 TaxID=3077789 RepID=UPI0028ECE1B8|nr:class I SAM-dependent methyltransferase [Domibacillus sp. DTU_2020_1001157_1_SI_ALB_TIR_016]WNS81686.1 class I SAM-dependent methyltransferase [Domibacillus sp. DTU_2020_1001157_1_SI_ALB_TIR_016]